MLRQGCDRAGWPFLFVGVAGIGVNVVPVMTRYLLAFGLLGCACIAYIILALGARFDRTDEMTGDADTQSPVGQGVEGEGHIHFGSANK